ncbi:phytoene desaturase [Amaricoccus solimangrovi]|uniref:Phytoene dehydrogenase n=1 Tax=Amaricoccus solimangrovi TaxID=2589815 RepID=A0A501WA13_9RHOB|nr:phytoene desaturase [Amaricoccus solimangrovi]TPE46459.1 phytoene desaturase [Amaricoccus solimangrovi]
MSTAIVIGAGFGGLALAIRLQSAGIRTTLIEGRDKPGGRAYVWREQGHVFDAGPTVITDPDSLRELWGLSGQDMARDVTLLPVSPFYRLLWDDGRRFDYLGDAEGLEAQIAAFDPADVAGYRRFHAYAEEVYREGYLRLGAVPFLRFRQMLSAAPVLVRLEAYRSVHSLVARFIRDPHLRQAFSFHTLLVGGNPFSTSAIYALIHALERRGGVWFAKGGTNALVAGMLALFERLGGRLLLDAPVARIETEGSRATAVILASGERLAADMIASNADVMHTYRDLLAGTRRGRVKAAILGRQRWSMSLFVLHFGLDKAPEGLAHHTILFGPRYRELVSEIFRGPGLPEDFSLYLHSPCVTDPSLAPPGMSTHYVLAPVPHLGRARVDWARESEAYSERILAALEARVIPGLRAHLRVKRAFTPADFAGALNAHHGSAFSVEPILAQSAWFRPHNRDRTLRNLYLVGAGTHPGAGIPGVVGSAKATAAVMLSDAARA